MKENNEGFYVKVSDSGCGFLMENGHWTYDVRKAKRFTKGGTGFLLMPHLQEPTSNEEWDGRKNAFESLDDADMEKVNIIQNMVDRSLYSVSTVKGIMCVNSYTESDGKLQGIEINFDETGRKMIVFIDQENTDVVIRFSSNNGYEDSLQVDMFGNSNDQTISQKINNLISQRINTLTKKGKAESAVVKDEKELSISMNAYIPYSESDETLDEAKARAGDRLYEIFEFLGIDLSIHEVRLNE